MATKRKRRSTLPAKQAKRILVRQPDAGIRDQGKVHVGGVINLLPVVDSDEAIRDTGKVRVGGV
jgi:hypothetical protein